MNIFTYFYKDIEWDGGREIDIHINATDTKVINVGITFNQFNFQAGLDLIVKYIQGLGHMSIHRI